LSSSASASRRVRGSRNGFGIYADAKASSRAARKQCLAGADFARDLDEALAVFHSNEQRVQCGLMAGAGVGVGRVGCEAKGQLVQTKMRLVHVSAILAIAVLRADEVAKL
jgi:hypothetical protein